ncbi:phosphoribosyltransferase [Agromyces sp. MMS24-K17]|uniref:phosphoribosyltransferase n=1 Tax=Agromyces sp. MMS24-K17 TaxID=3372850 RepID=UPI003754C39E
MLGLPRGGVPVAAEVARALDAPLDVLVVRKVGVPGRSEVAMGAVGEGGVTVRNGDVLRAVGIGGSEFDAAAARERREVEARVTRFREGRPPTWPRHVAAPLAGRTAIVVDDGIATGATARVACRIARALGAARVVLAVPVAPPDALRRLRAADGADEVVALLTPHGFMAVGMHFVDFRQTPDDEVVALLREAADRRAGDGSEAD